MNEKWDKEDATLGLDMWLYRARRDSRSDEDIRGSLNKGDISKHEKPEELICWRKANQIRHWMFNNLESFVDEGCSIVTQDNLNKLISDISMVLNKHSRAEELMPTSFGFFFGDVSYDEDYYETLKWTLGELRDISESTDFENDYLFYREWY